jgi:methyltransferase (TIGR00027 family)
MQAGEPSQTAMGAAGMRAAHLAGPGPYVFEDPWALALTSEMYRELDERGELRDFFSRLGMTPIEGQILGRARWNEDALEASLADGIAQYVVLGAGLDSFALRRADLLDRLDVFELDHPDTQRYKLARLEELGMTPDPRVRFVEVDFEGESSEAALARSGFAADAPAFFSWLGVVTYLSRDDVLRTLAGIRAATCAGSLVALDYPIAPEVLAEGDRALFESVRQGSAELGEPRRATYVPEVLRREICALGYRCVEDLSSEQHRERYFANRSDGLRPYPQVRLARFETL